MAKINTVISLTDEVTRPLRNIENQLGKTTGGFSALSVKIFSVNQAMQLFRGVANGISSVTAKINEMTSAYDFQAEQELKLETVMHNHMGATKEQIQLIKDFASAEQQAGVYGDEMILQGAQELATYVENVDTLKGLIPIMNSMLAQGVGANATARDMQSYATMIGKVMQGQVGGMSIRGYKFTDEEKEILKTGTELQKLEILQRNVIGNFGDMNRALAGNKAGYIQQINNEMGDLKETIGSLLKPLQTEIKNFKSIITRDFYATLKNILEKIIPIVNRVVQAFQNIYMKARPYLQKLGDFITNVLGKAINWVVDNLQGIVDAVAILASVMVAKIAIMAGAWAVMNWHIILIVGLIAVIIKAMNDLGLKCKDIGKVVGAVLGGAFVFIHNVIAQIYNLFISLYDFIVNLGKNPVQALANLFLDMFSAMDGWLKMIADIIDAIGKATGHDWNLSESFEKAKDFWQNLKFTEDMSNSKKMDLLDENDYLAYIQKGSALGEEIGSGLDKGLNLVKDAITGIDNDAEIQNALNKTFDFGGGGGLSVVDKDLIEVADDYKELLSKRATEKFNLQFSQMTPEINVGGITINNDVDVDKVFDTITDAVEEAEATSLAS